MHKITFKAYTYIKTFIRKVQRRTSDIVHFHRIILTYWL